MEFLRQDSMVEVRRQKPGYDEAWFAAKILKSYPNNKFLVEFLIYNQPYNPPYKEVVDISVIRPPMPPPAPDHVYHLHDLVEAFSANGWWKGVVVEVIRFRKYRVLLQNPPQYLTCSPKQLRLPFIWSHTLALWLPQQELAVAAGCMKVGISPNQHQAGFHNRKEESSKKRERELDAQLAATESSEKRQRGLNAEVPASAGKNTVLKTNEDPAEVINGVNVETLKEASAVNGQAESQDLPFGKSFNLWKEIDSLEIFRILPQKPHFNFLSDCNEETREGSAIGLMLTFVSVVEKVTKLQIDDPISLFDRYLEALAILEEIGFDVKVVVNRVNELLILKRRREELDGRLKTYQRSVAECDGKKTKLEQEIAALDKMMMAMTITMSALEEHRAMKVSQMVKEDSVRDYLQLEVSSLKNVMLDVEHKFKVKSSGPWHTRI
ncbi:protein of unknown function 724 7 [Euphorbia peplus]|nr:protein of unknown function 724 7 [Euphorbia peplus]